MKEIGSDSEARSRRKRKFGNIESTELEIDVSAPEPPSKKALRKASKEKKHRTTLPSVIESQSDSKIEVSENAKPAAAHRSEFGIWIGNLPFTANKEDVQNFLTKTSTVKPEHITRVNLPSGPHQNRKKPKNKGFAYVDFSTADALDAALQLSEKLLSGRRVLIKSAKNFDGRPQEPQEGTVARAGGDQAKTSSKRIFVGNLGFDVSKEDLVEHFGRCGTVADIHMATFEDSGKCKGFAWIEFEDIGAAEAAIRGWVKISVDEVPNSEKETTDKKEKTRKWWVNRIQGRPLRMEFAEDKAIRYKKRFGKDGTKKISSMPNGNDLDPVSVDLEPALQDSNGSSVTRHVHSRPLNTEPNRRHLSQMNDSTTQSRYTLSTVQKLSGTIVESQGKKTTFDRL